MEVILLKDVEKVGLRFEKGVKNVEYAAESDAGPFPVPDNTPIEGWPAPWKAMRPWT